MLVHPVQFVHHGLGIRVLVFVEAHRVPAVFAPPLPVLHDGADGNLFVAEAAGGGQQFVLRVEAFAAVDVAEDPVRERRDVAGERAEAAHHRVGAAGEDDIVEPLRHRGREDRLVRDGAPIDDGGVAEGALDIERVLSGGELRLDGDGRRQPGVRDVDERFAVHGQILPAGHVAPYIKQQGVFPVRGEFDPSGETPEKCWYRTYCSCNKCG